jgi:transposase
MCKEELEGYLADGLSLEQIGKRVGRHASTVSYHLKKHGLRPVNQRRHRERGALPKAELEQLHAQGASLREIAEHFDRGVNTVRYWLQKYELGPTTGGLRRAAIKQARLAGKRDVELECPRHGTSAHVLEKGGRVRCKRCRSQAVSESRRRIKRILVEEAGGACLICGYDRCIAALEFHHRDRKKKLFALSRKGATRSLQKARAEARKCILLCSNCHVEVENGVTRIPLHLVREEGPGDGNLTSQAA